MPDVVVVGGGIAGASAAFHLTMQGARTTLVERAFLASGPTGRSSAITHAFYLLPELSQLAHRGCEQLRHLEDLTGGTADYREVGMLWVVGSEPAAEWRDAVARIRGEDAVIEVVEPQALADLAPGFVLDDVALGVWEPAGGYADPSSATTSFAAAAQAKGAEVLLEREVVGLLVEGGRVRAVETDRGERLEADAVVLAVGPWTRELVAQVGVDLPLTVERHPMAVVSAPGRAREVMPWSWCDDRLANYARPEGDDLVLVGTWAGGGTAHRDPHAERGEDLDDPMSYKEGVDAEESAWILGHLTPRRPVVAELPVRSGYAGLYDMSPDDLPVIGAVPGTEGLTVVAGSSGHGFKLGPAVGEEVARLLTSGDAPLLAPFSPARFL